MKDLIMNIVDIMMENHTVNLNESEGVFNREFEYDDEDDLSLEENDLLRSQDVNIDSFDGYSDDLIDAIYDLDYEDLGEMIDIVMNSR